MGYLTSFNVTIKLKGVTGGSSLLFASLGKPYNFRDHYLNPNKLFICRPTCKAFQDYTKVKSLFSQWCKYGIT